MNEWTWLTNALFLLACLWKWVGYVDGLEFDRLFCDCFRVRCSYLWHVHSSFFFFFWWWWLTRIMYDVGLSITKCIVLWTTCEMRNLRGDLSGAGKGAGVMKLCSPVFRKWDLYLVVSHCALMVCPHRSMHKEGWLCPSCSYVWTNH